MSASKYNSKRRSTFNFFTRSFSNSKNGQQLQHYPKDQVIKILITRANHRLGNQLLISPLLQEIQKQYPNCKLHLVLNGTLSTVLFSNYENVEKVFNLPKKPFNNIVSYLKAIITMMCNRYDIAIAACEASNSSKIFVKLSRARYKIYDSGTHQIDKPKHIGKYPIYNFKKFINPAEDLSAYHYSKLSIKLSEQEVEQGKTLLHTLVGNSKKTICIFTFATGHKCHSQTWWQEFYDRLYAAYSAYNILEILPFENVSQIDFKSTHYYSKDLREIASVIENSVLFIGADSGMMHLSTATNTPTFGLFNVTKSDVYEPYGGKNRAIDTNALTMTDILKIIDITIGPEVPYNTTIEA